MALSFKVTTKLRCFLEQASSNLELPQPLACKARALTDQSEIPWGTLKELVAAARKVGMLEDDGGPWCYDLCKNSGLVLPQPPPPRQYAPEFKARLAKLQAEVENKQYQNMVADVTIAERRAAEKEGLLPTTRLQLSFGLHVLAMMGTFYAMGYYAGRFLNQNELWATLWGVAGMASALLLETTLLIIRTNRPEPLAKRFPHLTDPHLYHAAQESRRKARAAMSAMTQDNSPLVFEKQSSGRHPAQDTGNKENKKDK